MRINILHSSRATFTFIHNGPTRGAIDSRRFCVRLDLVIDQISLIHTFSSSHKFQKRENCVGEQKKLCAIAYVRL